MHARPFPHPGDGDLFRRLVDSLPSYAVILLDCDGRVQHANPAAETIYGYESVALRGRPFATLLSPSDSGPERADDMLACAVSNGSLHHEARHRRRDGTDFDADVLVSSVRADDQRLLGYAIVIRDLSDRRRSESSDQDRVQALEKKVTALTQELAARGANWNRLPTRSRTTCGRRCGESRGISTRCATTSPKASPPRGRTTSIARSSAPTGCTP